MSTINVKMFVSQLKDMLVAVRMHLLSSFFFPSLLPFFLPSPYRSSSLHLPFFSFFISFIFCFIFSCLLFLKVLFLFCIVFNKAGTVPLKNCHHFPSKMCGCLVVAQSLVCSLQQFLTTLLQGKIYCGSKTVRNIDYRLYSQQEDPVHSSCFRSYFTREGSVVLICGVKKLLFSFSSSEIISSLLLLKYVLPC